MNVRKKDQEEWSADTADDDLARRVADTAAVVGDGSLGRFHAVESTKVPEIADLLFPFDTSGHAKCRLG